MPPIRPLLLALALSPVLFAASESWADDRVAEVTTWEDRGVPAYAAVTDPAPVHVILPRHMPDILTVTARSAPWTRVQLQDPKAELWLNDADVDLAIYRSTR